MLIGQYLNYREFLKDELERRVQVNPQYSLRAFARDIQISPQVLSDLLKEKKGISSEVAIRIAERLGLSTEESSYFYDLVELSQARSESVRQVIRYRLGRYQENETYRTLQEDIFRIIADWHHYAILELTFTKGFKKDPAWIAKRLNITPIEVRQAIERLLRLELLEEVDGTIKKTEVNITTLQDVPSAAIRKLTAQLLTKASESLETQEVSERDFGTMTMAIDPKRLPEAKERIRKFRRELTVFLESGERTEVYNFGSQLFRLSRAEGQQRRQ
ncbi:MAG: hypothetical protein A3K03_13815 [Bdellovibrionales bacterium RIFOXYD1_FULL_44_7]|nr:MAG: hypothetical protein A3K03_13815 [Bdellovibrionales bacterium RIFOXYD1_FULL_44_7]